MSTGERWNLNRHTVRCISSLAMLTGVWLITKKTEISADLWVPLSIGTTDVFASIFDDIRNLMRISAGIPSNIRGHCNFIKLH